MNRRSRRAFLIGGAGSLGAVAAWSTIDNLPPLYVDRGQSGPPDRALRDFRSMRPEGGRIVLDRAQMPTRFHEAPQLAERVRRGELPPIESRLGQDPLVIAPLHRIGRYGGTLRRAFIGPSDSASVTRFAAGPDSLLYWDYDWRTLLPNIARGYEISADGRETTLFLRRGMRWSDGAPFTADDIVFWYEDMYSDRRVVPSATPTMQVDGEGVIVRRIDENTVQFVAPRPYPMLAEVLAGYNDIAGPSNFGRMGMGSFAPKHYLSRFHPKYRSEPDVTREAREAGFFNWSIYLKNRNDWTLNTDLPVVSPWRAVTAINTETFFMERNPYSIWVDTAGNQLPYIDSISHVLCSGPDAVSFKADAGELDYQNRHLSVAKLPYLLSNQGRSRYRVHLSPYEGTDIAIRLNIGYEQDPEIGTLLRDIAFRRALALGIDREAINETLMLGTGRPTASVPAPGNKYSPGPDWDKKWAVHDVARANAMLDALGLKRRLAGGIRQRRDGQGPLRLQCQTFVAHFDYPSIAEMIQDQWKAIGIDLDIQVLDSALWMQRSLAGTIQLAIQLVANDDPITYPDLLFPSAMNSTAAFMGVDYARWFQSSGKNGKTPPPEILGIIDLWRRGRATANPDERIAIGRKIIELHVDNVLSIGVISAGLSFYGIQIANEKLVNVPRRLVNSTIVRSPANALPMTFFYDA